MERGQLAAAMAAFSHCLRLAPNHSVALFNLANAQLLAGHTADAAATFVRCLRIAPTLPGAHLNLATALLRLGLLDEARGMAEIALALTPGAVEPLLCHAAILHHAGAHAAAAATYRAALSSAPAHTGALSSLGNSLRAAGRLDEAMAEHDRALALAPDDATLRFNRALTLLAAGHYTEGWREYEWRWRRPGHPPHMAGVPWHGEKLNGRTILLHAEQGFGDTLQFVRYAPMVARRGGRVVLEVQPELVRLLRPLPGVAAILARGEHRPPFDLHCPLMSLPSALGTTLDTIPPAVAIPLDPERTAGWRARRHPGRRNVGLVWAGAPHLNDAEAHLLDQRRSLPIACLGGLATLPGVTFVSLQHRTAPPEIPGLDVIDALADAQDFADTAAVIAALDLVIAVDSAVAHLAATMGKPVWLLSRYDGCWRWLHGRRDSPWYPTLTIYRQPRPGDWACVVADIRRDLEAGEQETGAG